MKKIKEIGICNDGTNVVNNSKLEKLIQFADEDYNEMKIIEKCGYNFIIKIPNANISLGDTSADYKDSNNIITITRIIALNNSLAELKIIMLD